MQRIVVFFCSSATFTRMFNLSLSRFKWTGIPWIAFRYRGRVQSPAATAIFYWRAPVENFSFFEVARRASVNYIFLVWRYVRLAGDYPVRWFAYCFLVHCFPSSGLLAKLFQREINSAHAACSSSLLSSPRLSPWPIAAWQLWKSFL